MRPFTLFKIWRNKEIHDFEIEQFESIDQAKAQAWLMIQRHGYDAIEILDGEFRLIVTKQDQRLS